jgi:sensor histidine kinase YesM
MELVDSLNQNIAKWDVHIVDGGTANLEVEINVPGRTNNMGSFIDRRKTGNEIIKTIIDFNNLKPTTDSLLRVKTIRYYFLKSLIEVPYKTAFNQKLPGSVFCEKRAEDITFHPVDFQIIREVYSMKYEQSRSKASATDFSEKIKKNRAFSLLSNIFSFVLVFLFFILMIQKGIFVNHHYQFDVFMKQALIVFVGCLIYITFITFFHFFISKPPVMNIKPDSNSLIHTAFKAISIITVSGFASILLIFYAERYMLMDNNNMLQHVTVAFLTTLFIPSSIILLIYLTFSGDNNSKAPLDVINILLADLTLTLILSIFRASFIFFNRTTENIILKKDVELAKLGELHKQAELQSLRSKINPHFLYNSLNSIASLTNTNPQKAETMALKLSDFFKYAINREQKQFNTVNEELNAIRTYLDIEKVRFGNRLNFEIECLAELEAIQIPQFLIQPLVENALKHGLSKVTGEGIVKIIVTKNQNMLNTRVYDNGPAFPEGPLSGFGIRNTQERIMLLYGNKAAINWQNGEEKFIEINLPVN